MKLRKFTARTMKEAIAEVKAELGPDAMIVATRELERGLRGSAIEVTAAIEADDVELPVETKREVAVAGAPVITDDDIERIMAPLRSELRSIRAQMPAPQPRPDTARIDNELVSMRAAIARLSGRIQPVRTPNLAAIARTQPIAAPPTCRAIAILGPTGAGKTTTIGKLAAREALVAGKSVAIISLDTYRVGGEDQIRIFADLIGVPLATVSSLEELPRAFHKFAAYDRVLIDTAGRSPRDKTAISDTVHALRRIADLETHLAVPAATPPALIDRLLDTYGETGVDRLLFTKLDEALDLRELVEAPARLGRPVSYITTGQRVPEDLEEASWNRLLALAEEGLEMTQEVAA